MELNQEQLNAVMHPQGDAALLLAGAGSGKTAVLTERISWLIEQGVPSRSILALTFTNKAANEIRARVLAKTGLSEDMGPRLSTIHSLALSMIRRNPRGFDLGEKISPLDDYAQTELVKKIVAREELGDLNPYTILEQIEFHRARGVGFAVDYTEEVHKRARHQHAGYHAMGLNERKVWKLFEDEKRSNGSIDFSDMIWIVLRRMMQDAEWLGKLQTVFSHVLLDEAQDTNIPQFKFINNLLGATNRNLFVVGDLAQSIFAFNGASPYLLNEYAEDWRGKPPVVYKLVRNHRSVPQVVSFANAVRDKMTDVISLSMESFRGDQGENGRMRLLRGETPAEIARSAANHIRSTGRPFKDFALLVRTSMQIRDIEGELVRQRIPYVVRGGRGLLQTEEVRDILSYLRFAVNTRDFAALSRSISSPRRGIGTVALESLRKRAIAEFDGDLLKACASAGDKYQSYADTIRAIQGLMEHPGSAVQVAVGFSMYLEHVRKKYSKDLEKVQNKTENLQRLKLMIDGMADDGEMSTEDIIFQLTMEKSEEDDQRGSVTISTIHSAKGLEWPTVWVTNLVDGQLPHWRSIAASNDDSESEVAEERRLFYVAVTRARDECFLCVSEMSQRGQSLSECEPSRFLTELGVV